MNPYKRPAVRSAIIIAFFLTVWAWSYLTSGGNKTTSIPYLLRSGFVTDHVNARDEGYYVTIVWRSGHPPWLIVAKPLPLHRTAPYSTVEMSSGKHSVTIDGHEYDEEVGQCIVALNDGQQLTVQRIPQEDLPLLAALPASLSEMSVADLKSILTVQK